MFSVQKDNYNLKDGDYELSSGGSISEKRYVLQYLFSKYFSGILRLATISILQKVDFRVQGSSNRLV